MQNVAEAIPGSRVIVNKQCIAHDLHGATAVVLGEATDNPGSVAIKLDEPYAKRWGRTNINLFPRSLDPAPTYTALVEELATTRETKDTLTQESSKLAQQLTEARADIRARDEHIRVAGQANATLRGAYDSATKRADDLQRRLDEALVQKADLEADIVSPLAEWERELLDAPARRFEYVVCSTSDSSKFYTITVCNNEVISCTCLGWHFSGYCKHASSFRIPLEAQIQYHKDNELIGRAKERDILRQAAELLRPFLS